MAEKMKNNEVLNNEHLEEVNGGEYNYEDDPALKIPNFIEVEEVHMEEVTDPDYVTTIIW